MRGVRIHDPHQLLELGTRGQLEELLAAHGAAMLTETRDIDGRRRFRLHGQHGWVEFVHQDGSELELVATGDGLESMLAAEAAFREPKAAERRVTAACTEQAANLQRTLF